MKQYKVKAYRNGKYLSMVAVVEGRRMAEAYKRVYIKDYKFTSKDIEIIRL